MIEGLVYNLLPVALTLIALFLAVSSKFWYNKLRLEAPVALPLHTSYYWPERIIELSTEAWVYKANGGPVALFSIECLGLAGLTLFAPLSWELLW